MDISKALELHSNGIWLRVDVSPASSKLLVPAGFNPWRNSIEVKLTKPASNGKANKQLLSELASLFGLSPSFVEVQSGHKSSRKVILIRGATLEVLVNKLTERLSCEKSQ